MCSFKSLTTRKNKTIENDWDYDQKWSTWASQFISRNHVFGILFLLQSEAAILELFKQQWFSWHIHLTVSHKYMVRKQQEVTYSNDHRPLRKTTWNWKYQYFIRRLTNSPPNKKKMTFSKCPHRAPRKPPWDPLDPTLDPSDPPQHLPDPFGPPKDPRGPPYGRLHMQFTISFGRCPWGGLRPPQTPHVTR